MAQARCARPSSVHVLPAFKPQASRSPGCPFRAEVPAEEREPGDQRSAMQGLACEGRVRRTHDAHATIAVDGEALGLLSTRSATPSIGGDAGGKQKRPGAAIAPERALVTSAPHTQHVFHKRALGQARARLRQFVHGRFEKPATSQFRRGCALRENARAAWSARRMPWMPSPRPSLGGLTSKVLSVVVAVGVRVVVGSVNADRGP